MRTTQMSSLRNDYGLSTTKAHVQDNCRNRIRHVKGKMASYTSGFHLGVFSTGWMLRLSEKLKTQNNVYPRHLWE